MENGPRHVALPRGELIDHLTHDLCDLANETQAAAIIKPTSTGRTARLIARHRTGLDIIAISTNEAVTCQLAVVWGVRGVTMPFALMRGDDRIEAAVRAAFLAGAVIAGCLVLVLAGHPIEGGDGFRRFAWSTSARTARSCEP
jgi:pyruvate kinase